MTPGQALAQTVHAAGESAALWRRHSASDLPPDTRAVALVAPPATLLQLEARLQADGVSHVAVREPDLGFALVAIGLAPTSRERARRHTSRLPLAGGPRQSQTPKR